MRVSRSWSECGTHLLTLFDKFTKVAVFEHEADDEVSRTHIHVLMMEGVKGTSEDSIRNKWLKPVYFHKMEDKTVYDYMISQTYRNGKTSYAVNEGYITYMGKSVLKPVWLKGWGSSYVEDLVQKWVTPQPSSTSKSKIDPEAKRRKRYDIIQDVLSDLRNNTHLSIPELVVQHLIRNKEILGKWKVIDMIDAVEMYNDSESYTKRLMNFIHERASKIF